LSLIRDYYIRFQLLVHEVAKFGVVGAVGFVVQLGVQNALHYGVKLGPETALVIAYMAATVVTFVGNRHWAFKHRKGKGLRRESMTFVVLNCVGIAIQLGILDIAYYGMGYKDGLSYNIATVMGIGVATVFRLFAYRKFVFLEPSAGGDDQADELASASVR
jgi:putative flippase GtrA